MYYSTKNRNNNSHYNKEQFFKLTLKNYEPTVFISLLPDPNAITGGNDKGTGTGGTSVSMSCILQ